MCSIINVHKSHLLLLKLVPYLRCHEKEVLWSNYEDPPEIVLNTYIETSLSRGTFSNSLLSYPFLPTVSQGKTHATGCQKILSHKYFPKCSFMRIYYIVFTYAIGGNMQNAMVIFWCPFTEDAGNENLFKPLISNNN